MARGEIVEDVDPPLRLLLRVVPLCGQWVSIVEDVDPPLRLLLRILAPVWLKVRLWRSWALPCGCPLRISTLCALKRDCGGHGPSPAASPEDLCPLVARGEIVEDVDPPLRLDTPLLLVKPPMGLSTPGGVPRARPGPAQPGRAPAGAPKLA